MKISKRQRLRPFYLALVLMLTALILFSLSPLITTIVQASQSQTLETGDRTVAEAQVLASEVTGYELVLQREPDNVNAWRGLLEARLRQGNVDGTLVPLTKLSQLSPQTIDYGLLLAQTQQYLKNYAGAKTTYQDLLATHPGDMRVLKGMVDLLIGQDLAPEAVQLVQANLAQASNPQYASPDSAFNLTSLQLLLGEIYGQTDRYGEAIAVYDRAIKDNAQDFRPLLAKAQLLKAKGKTEMAAPLFQQAVKLAPVQYKDQIKSLAAQAIAPPANPEPLVKSAPLPQK